MRTRQRNDSRASSPASFNHIMACLKRLATGICRFIQSHRNELASPLPDTDRKSVEYDDGGLVHRFLVLLRHRAAQTPSRIVDRVPGIEKPS